MKRRLAYLLPAGALLLRRHEVHSMWLDFVRDIHGWQLAMFRDELYFTLLVAAAVYCVVALVWHWLRYERPANRRRKAQP